MKRDFNGWRIAVESVSMAALGVMSPIGASADDAATSVSAVDPVGLETVVVTARRVEERLHDVPMSLEVATGKALQQFNVFDAKQIQSLVPGLSVTNTNGRNNSAAIRGIGFDPDQGGSPAVDVYINDVPVDGQTAFTAIYDLQQAEVLRGPQGSLRGRTAPAGAILMTTRRPDLHQMEGYAQLTGGGDSTFNLQGAVSLPLVDGKLAVRLAGVTDQGDLNHVDNVHTGRRSHSQTNSGRVSVEWQPADTLSFRLVYEYLEAEQRVNQQVFGAGNSPFDAFCFISAGFVCDPTRSGPTAQAGDYLAVDEIERRFENTTNRVMLGFDWDLGYATLSGLGSYQETKLEQSLSSDPANAFPGWTGPASNDIPYPVTVGELRLTSRPADFWNWSMEAFYQTQGGITQARTTNDTFFVPAPAYLGLYLPVTTRTAVPVDVETASVAASSSFQFTDQLKLEVAARYSERNNDQTATAHVFSPGYPGNPAFGIAPIPGFDIATPLVPTALAETKSTPLTGGATLSYAISPDFMTYVAYAHAARDATAGVAIPANMSLDLMKAAAEKSDAFELGAKTYLPGRTLTLNGDVFYQKFEDFISRFYGIYYDNGARNVFGVPVGPPDGIVDGSFDFNYNGDATVTGAELTLAGRPVDNWDFSLSAAYAKARYDDASLPCNDFDGSGKPNTNGTPAITGAGNISYCTSDDRLGNLPDWNANFNTEVRFPQADGFEYYARTLINYRPGFASSTMDYRYEDLTMVDIYLGARTDRWDLGLYVKNLLDEQKITNLSEGTSSGGVLLPTAAGIAYDSGYKLANTTHPIQFGASVVYRF